MRTPATISLIAGLVISLTAALADDDRARAVPATSLLYLDQQGWEKASGQAKAGLAADFMRVFCGSAAMPAAVLVDCLDHSAGAGAMFERALACVAAVPGLQSR